MRNLFSRPSRAAVWASALATLVAIAQPVGPVPLAGSLECPKGDCPLLHGAPQTMGMRSGFVRLQPGATVGWHSTGQHEEALVILRGHGEAQIDGRPKQPIAGPGYAYIPPATRHNVMNTGKEPLEYVYVVAPTVPR
jgi:quercetin dioxygenase-like cupin family protein